jgi:hypothetical protein
MDMFDEAQQTSARSAYVQIPSLPEGRLALVFVLAISMFSLCFMLHPQKAGANAYISYSCGSQSNPNHCYGIVDWPNPVNGAYTEFLVNHLNSGDTFVLNDLWIIDNNNERMENCTINGGPITACWVEGGYKAFGPTFGSPWSGTERLFWADVRPNGGWHEHRSAPLVSGDYGSYLQAQIWKAGTDPFVGWCPTVSNEWCVSLIAGSTSLNVQYSTNNSMQVTEYKEGLEISGISGGYAPLTDFDYNEWSSTRNNNYYYQTNPGNETTNYPADAYWDPAPQDSSTGGSLWTCITNAGC